MRNPDPLYYFEDERSFADKCVDRFLSALGFLMFVSLVLVVSLAVIP